MNWRPRTDPGPQYPRRALDYYLEVGRARIRGETMDTPFL